MKIWTKLFLMVICAIAVSVAGTAFAAAPTGFDSQEYFDTNGDGTVDTAVVVINGGIALTNCDVGATELVNDWIYIGNGIGGSIASATCDMPSATITFVITGANSDTTGADGNQPTIAYIDGPVGVGNGSIANGPGMSDPLTDVSPQNILDKAKPVYISAEAVSDTVVEVEFSENMNDEAGYLPNSAGFTATGMTVTAATVRIADDTFIDLTVNPLNDTGFTATDFAIAVDTAYDYDENGTALSTNLFISDAQAPELLDAFTEDVDGNGKIDTVSFLFSERMNNMFRGVGGMAVIGYTVPAGTGTWESDIGTDDLFVVAITETGSACSANDTSGCDTDATPNVTYMQGGEELEDMNGIHLGMIAPTPSVDEAAPAIVGVEYAETNMEEFDVDTIIVYYSEDITLNQYDDADWTITPGSVDDLGAVNETGAIVVNGNEIHLNVNWNDNVTGESGTEPTLTYTDNVALGSVNDGVEPTPAEDFGPVVMEDDMGPSVLNPNSGNTPYAMNMDENETDVDTMDISEDVDYSLSGADAGLFDISVAGVLTFSSAPDFENPTDNGGDGTYNVQVDSDDGNASVDMVFNITVDDVNEAPVITSVTPTVRPENSISDQTIAATDQDAGDSITYTISGGVDGALFGVDGNILTFNDFPDYENPLDADLNNVYDVTVRATDIAGLFHDYPVAVSITDENERAEFTSSDSVLVDENQTAIIKVTAHDPESDGVTFTKTGGADETLFTLTGDILTFTAAPDFENPTDSDVDGDYRVEITATEDGGGLTSWTTISVEVDDVNVAPDDISLWPQVVNENEAIGTVVGDLSNDDDGEDNPATYIYSLVAGAGDTDNGSFSVVGDELQTAEIFDYETQSSYDIRINVNDGVYDYSTSFSVDIADLNDVPTDMALDSSSVDENEVIGTVVGNLDVTDDGEDNPVTYTYSLPAVLDNASFSISGAELQTAEEFDYEIESSYSIVVSVNDGVHNFSKDFRITVNDVNEAPTDMFLDSSSVDENQTAGTVIGNLDVTDNGEDGTYIYSLVAGAGDTDNASFQVSGNELQSNEIFDYETKNSYSIRLNVNDDVHDFSKNFTIDVKNVNDPPVITSGPTVDVPENTTPVRTETATDEDVPVQTLSFSIIGGLDQTKFSIEPVSGDLTFNTAPDFENPTDSDTNNTYVVEVLVTDNGTLPETDSQVITVTVDDVNEGGTEAPLYRFWNNKNKAHFYTASEEERDYVIANYDDDIWKYEGVASGVFATQVPNSTAVYRFWSQKHKSHFYTASEAEKNYVIANYDDYIWKYEGIGYYAYPTHQPSTQPMHRFWSKKNKAHFYTASEAEKKYIIEHYDDYAWKYEGIAWYVGDDAV